jgi:hypothetical protein
MKSLKGITILFLVLFSIKGIASTPIETLVPIEHIYVPKGFDSNDNTEVIVEGTLPNLCHKSPMTKVEMVDGKVQVTVTALKYHESNPYCIQVEVPFIQPVSLGVMDKGIYDIVVNGKSVFEKSSSIMIAESTSSAVDDHIYANVSYVEDKDETGRKVKLVGYTPSDCLEFEEVGFVDNEKDVVAVLPKMKQVYEHCPMKMVPFEKEVEVPKNLKRDKVLLHVRAMNGKSVNALFDNTK